MMRKVNTLLLAALAVSLLGLSGCSTMPKLSGESTAEEFDPYAITWQDSAHPLRYQRAVRHLRAGRYAEAEAVYRELIDLEPESPNPYVGLGASLNLQERFEEARDAYLEGLEHSTGSAQIYIGLGSALYRLGNYEEAYQNYMLALELERNSPQAIWGVSIALEAAGRPAEAVPYWQQIIEMEPGSQRASWAEDMLEQYSE